MAVFACQSASLRASSARARSEPDPSITIRTALSRSLSFVARTSTMRLPKVFPSRTIAPGYDSLHHFRLHAEGGRAFARIEHSNAPARSRPNVKQPSAGPQTLGDNVDRLGDVGQRRLNRLGRQVVLGMQSARKLVCGK